MNMPNDSEIKKIILVVMVFVILLVGLLIVRGGGINTKDRFAKIEPTQPIPISEPVAVKTKIPEKKLAGQMRFNNIPKSIKIGTEFEITVDFSANGKVLDGSDAIIRFDKSQIEIVGITNGEYFQLYPRKTIDNNNGVVKVTAFQARDDKPIENQITLFTLALKAKKAGTIPLKFDYIKGKTNLSTVVEKGTSQNILGSVQNTEIVATL